MCISGACFAQAKEKTVQIPQSGVFFHATFLRDDRHPHGPSHGCPARGSRGLGWPRCIDGRHQAGEVEGQRQVVPIVGGLRPSGADLRTAHENRWAGALLLALGLLSLTTHAFGGEGGMKTSLSKLLLISLNANPAGPGRACLARFRRARPSPFSTRWRLTWLQSSGG